MKKKHILLAEDNDGDILLIKECLAEAGADIDLSIVKDGKAVKDFIGKQGAYTAALQPDIILLDINLPKITGFEMLKYIKGNDELKHIPVIILTSSGNEQDVNLAISNHANAYLVKPIDAEDFLIRIKALTDFWLYAAELPKVKKVS